HRPAARPRKGAGRREAERRGHGSGPPRREVGNAHRHAREGAVTMRRTTLALFVALTAAPALAQDKPDARRPVKVPFVLLPSRHMLMDVKVNGKGPYKLIFDTGAPINLVSSKLGKEAGLVKKDGGGLLGFGIFGGGLNQVEMKSLQLGDVTAEKLPSIV